MGVPAASLSLTAVIRITSSPPHASSPSLAAAVAAVAPLQRGQNHPCCIHTRTRFVCRLWAKKNGRTSPKRRDDEEEDPELETTNTSPKRKGVGDIIISDDSSRPLSSSSSTTTTTTSQRSRRSRVEDPYGPTPELIQDEPELVDPEDVVGIKEIYRDEDLPRPIPHQPWRRGETAGCEAPIAAPWRRAAEDIIETAVEFVGGKVLDVTWYLTQVVVTLDEDYKPIQNLAKSQGPVIDILEPGSPLYYDPADPNPEEIWDDQEEILYQRETEEEAREASERKRNMYATKDSDDPEDEPHITDQADGDEISLYANEETRAEVAMKITDDAQQRDAESEQPIDLETIKIDTAALSTIARAILDALEDREEELNILGRHELILTSPGASDVLETQRQFDAYRGFDVIVETQDPFQSNRTLKGKLVDRNSMDVIINKKGRMVTIPLNFVKCVRLPPAKREKGVPRDVPF